MVKKREKSESTSCGEDWTKGKMEEVESMFLEYVDPTLIISDISEINEGDPEYHCFVEGELNPNNRIGERIYEGFNLLSMVGDM